jgi:murein DD-endopeptidase MepM/ murein hydrolase activator NlpD
MVKSKFYNIVETEDILVSIPQESHFTIGTSPYYAHQHALGIDIYHSLHLGNYKVYSPISGEIIKTKTLLAPRAKFLGGINKDYLILVKNLHNPEITYKILHVKPNNLHVGERVEIGDQIGQTIRNGYFANWSSPHLHLEIRPTKDAIRASGGMAFSLAFNKTENKVSSEERKSNEMLVKVDSVFPEFLLGSFHEDLYKVIDPICGIKVRVNQIDCILDGGIPHYKNGTIISESNFELDKEQTIYLEGQTIGCFNESRGQFGFFKFNPSLKFYLNDEKIRGISLYLAKFKPFIKIIPYLGHKITLNANSTSQLTCTSI